MQSGTEQHGCCSTPFKLLKSLTIRVKLGQLVEAARLRPEQRHLLAQAVAVDERIDQTRAVWAHGVACGQQQRHRSMLASATPLAVQKRALPALQGLGAEV